MSDKDLIATAGKALANRELQARYLYYLGKQPRIWVTPKLRAMFRSLADSMNENYCDLAIHSRTTRMEVTGWEGTGAAAAEQLWDDTRMGKRQADLYRWGLVYGHTYLIAAEEDGGPVLAPQRPTILWHRPDAEDPTNVEVAVKYWFTRGVWRATIYDEDEIRRYVCPQVGQKPSKRPDANSFMLDEEEPGGPHGFDRVPVIPAYPFGAEAPCLIDTISPVQDRINKIGANKFIAAEFGAFRQRVFFTRQAIDDNDLIQQPDTALILDPGDPNNPTRVQEMSATDLANYDNAKAAEIDSLFTLALLPRHLRISGSSAQAPSGRAIKADEGPMVEAIIDHQREFGEAYEDALTLLGIEAEPVWRSPVTDDEIDQATTVRGFTDAGAPLNEVLKRYAGWTDEDLTAEGGAEVGGPVTRPDATGAALLQAFSAAPAEG